MNETQNTSSAESSNGILLTPAEWGWVLAVCIAVFLAAGPLWRSLEPFEPGDDYRLPYVLSEDYWHFERWCEEALRRDVLVVGDSVVWGEYVEPGASLAGALGRSAGGVRFANLGVNGIHPASLEGLLRYHGTALRGRKVLLHCNPLWLSSPRVDLSGAEDDFPLNHPRLVGQFFTRPASYRAEPSERIAAVLDRYSGLRGLAGHIRSSCFEGSDLHHWSIEHPRQSVTYRFTFESPAPGRTLRHEPVSWSERRGLRQAPRWVRPVDSFQWGAFQRVVKLLLERENNVFVLLGPYNEHMLTPAGLDAYRGVKDEITAWLRSRPIGLAVAGVLPSDLYADASHPLAPGYRHLAQQLAAHPAFMEWLQR